MHLQCVGLSDSEWVQTVFEIFSPSAKDVILIAK